MKIRARNTVYGGLLSDGTEASLGLSVVLLGIAQNRIVVNHSQAPSIKSLEII